MNVETNSELWRHEGRLERARLQALLQRSSETSRDLKSALQQLSEVVSLTRELVASSSTARIRRRELASQIAASSGNFHHLLRTAGLCEADLPAMTEGLIELYQNATALGDSNQIALIGEALHHLGRHLAQELGPRRAGVFLN